MTQQQNNQSQEAAKEKSPVAENQVQPGQQHVTEAEQEKKPVAEENDPKNADALVQGQYLEQEERGGDTADVDG